MPQSKKRNGAKAHRKKVQLRNDTAKKQQMVMQKLFEDSIRQQAEELRKKVQNESSGTTSNSGVESV